VLDQITAVLALERMHVGGFDEFVRACGRLGLGRFGHFLKHPFDVTQHGQPVSVCGFGITVPAPARFVLVIAHGGFT